MDKILLKFIADVLYLKGVICYDELDDIMNASIPSDLDVIFEKMMREEYNAYRREYYKQE
jgi:hypothetical protein